MTTQRSKEKTNNKCRKVFDPDFKHMYEVPSRLIVHVPPARLHITRLVVCRNYRRYESTSCAMWNNCRFVHADVDYSTLKVHPVHVNYIWQYEDLCTYPRLPPGDIVEVLPPVGTQPVEEILSERILVTSGAIQRSENNTRPLSHCAHYYCKRICNKGESCNFIHAMYLDPDARGEFKRAPMQPIPYFIESDSSSTTVTSEDSPTPKKGHLNPRDSESISMLVDGKPKLDESALLPLATLAEGMPAVFLEDASRYSINTNCTLSCNGMNVGSVMKQGSRSVSASQGPYIHQSVESMSSSIGFHDPFKNGMEEQQQRRSTDSNFHYGHNPNLLIQQQQQRQRQQQKRQFQQQQQQFQQQQQQFQKRQFQQQQFQQQQQQFQQQQGYWPQGMSIGRWNPVFQQGPICSTSIVVPPAFNYIHDSTNNIGSLVVPPLTAMNTGAFLPSSLSVSPSTVAAPYQVSFNSPVYGFCTPMDRWDPQMQLSLLYRHNLHNSVFQ